MIVHLSEGQHVTPLPSKRLAHNASDDGGHDLAQWSVRVACEIWKLIAPGGRKAQCEGAERR